LLAIIDAAGWPIWPLLIASVISLAIICERMWSLRLSLVSPRDLLPKLINELKQNGITPDLLRRLPQESLLGQVFAAGLRNSKQSREVMRESIEEAGTVVTHELERFLTTLGTIAAMSPLLGLFGTVVGMIELFGAQSPISGATNTAQLARGISIALYNTAFGLIVAIPSMIFYRYYQRKVETIVVNMEQQAVKLVEVFHGDRQG